MGLDDFAELVDELEDGVAGVGFLSEGSSG